MAGTSSYPLIPDFEAFARDRAPSVLRREPTWDVLLPLIEPLAALDQAQAEMVRDMDSAVATGAQLDACGHRVGEERRGLDDYEYRRIVLGAEAAAVSRGTWDGVIETWKRLTGATDGRWRAKRVPATGLPCVYLEGEVARPPSVLFLARAGVVIRAAVVASYDVDAHLYLAGAAFSGSWPGAGVGTSSWTL